MVETNLNIFCNAGKTITNMVGDLKGYGTVWYYPKGIANIFSLYRASKKFRVIFDSEDDNTFIVWNNDTNPRRFIPGPRGLYYCNMMAVSCTILTNLGINTVDGKQTTTLNAKSRVLSILEKCRTPSEQQSIQ